MIKKLPRRFALSGKGAKDMIKGSIASALQNAAFVFPAGLLYQLVKDLLDGGVDSKRVAFYVFGCIVCGGLILLATWFQYNGTFLATYLETGVRRIALAENTTVLFWEKGFGRFDIFHYE